MLGQSTTLFLNHDSGCILLEQYGTQFSLNFNYHYLFQFFKAKCRQLMYSISNEITAMSVNSASYCLSPVGATIDIVFLFVQLPENKQNCM